MVDTTLLETNRKLRQQLDFVIASTKPVFAPVSSVIPPYDVIISYNEINSHHGTGVLIQRMFRGCSSLLTIRSVDSYGGLQNFGELNFRLPAVRMSRARIFETVLNWVRATTVRRIVCVPWSDDDVMTAIALKEITNAQLCMYIMDDQNITKGRISDEVMGEALLKSKLRLVISSEMQYAYQNKYYLKFWLLPPLVDHQLLRFDPLPPARNPDRGVLVGNVWSQHWLDLLRETIRPSGIQIDWYCNSGSPWLKLDLEELRRDGLNLVPALPEKELAPALANYDFALVPSGTLDEIDDNRCVAQLSLPSRIPFMLATSHIPVIVIGNPKTAAARFVNRFEVGTTCGYATQDFQRAVRHVTNVETQKSMRERAARIAPTFSDVGAADWLWEALEQGAPSNLKFENLLAPQPGDFVYYLDPPVPEGLITDFHKIYQVLRRLQTAGFAPDFVVDVGASTGIWSETIKPLFPDARFILVEALASRYPTKQELLRRFPDFELAEVAISNQFGRMSFQVSSDLYNSSLFQVSEASAVSETVEIEVMTLDRLAQERNLNGRGLLKIDVQYAEHLIIEGGRDFIGRNVDVVAMELTLERVHPEVKTFQEMINLMSDLGFRYFDDVGEWRTPASGQLEQKDALFVRQGLF
jgi:FkbM family methyltransferase